MKEIKTRQELKEAVKHSRSVVMYGKEDCLHCSIVRTCIESVEMQYPLISFFFTEEKELAEKKHIEEFPVLLFYENGNIEGALVGSGKITKIKEMLNLWFLKD